MILIQLTNNQEEKLKRKRRVFLSLITFKKVTTPFRNEYKNKYKNSIIKGELICMV